eukprot:GILK01005949.1.p1 GENE.GILK01005949.1~~GILK01005949.1.p1  ORF type:complete len:1147 (+),score=208.93 GILK01005949.1:363-3443(+)
MANKVRKKIESHVKQMTVDCLMLRLLRDQTLKQQFSIRMALKSALKFLAQHKDQFPAVRENWKAIADLMDHAEGLVRLHKDVEDALDIAVQRECETMGEMSSYLYLYVKKMEAEADRMRGEALSAGISAISLFGTAAISQFAPTSSGSATTLSAATTIVKGTASASSSVASTLSQTVTQVVRKQTSLPQLAKIGQSAFSAVSKVLQVSGAVAGPATAGLLLATGYVAVAVASIELIKSLVNAFKVHRLLNEGEYLLARSSLDDAEHDFQQCRTLLSTFNFQAAQFLTAKTSLLHLVDVFKTVPDASFPLQQWYSPYFEEFKAYCEVQNPNQCTRLMMNMEWSDLIHMGFTPAELRSYMSKYKYGAITDFAASSTLLEAMKLYELGFLPVYWEEGNHRKLSQQDKDLGLHVGLWVCRECSKDYVRQLAWTEDVTSACKNICSATRSDDEIEQCIHKCHSVYVGDKRYFVYLKEDMSRSVKSTTTDDPSSEGQVTLIDLELERPKKRLWKKFEEDRVNMEKMGYYKVNDITTAEKGVLANMRDKAVNIFRWILRKKQRVINLGTAVKAPAAYASYHPVDLSWQEPPLEENKQKLFWMVTEGSTCRMLNSPERPATDRNVFHLVHHTIPHKLRLQRGDQPFVYTWVGKDQRRFDLPTGCILKSQGFLVDPVFEDLSLTHLIGYSHNGDWFKKELFTQKLSYTNFDLKGADGTVMDEALLVRRLISASGDSKPPSSLEQVDVTVIGAQITAATKKIEQMQNGLMKQYTSRLCSDACKYIEDDGLSIVAPAGSWPLKKNIRSLPVKLKEWTRNRQFMIQNFYTTDKKGKYSVKCNGCWLSPSVSSFFFEVPIQELADCTNQGGTTLHINKEGDFEVRCADESDELPFSAVYVEGIFGTSSNPKDFESFLSANRSVSVAALKQGFTLYEHHHKSQGVPYLLRIDGTTKKPNFYKYAERVWVLSDLRQQVPRADVCSKLQYNPNDLGENGEFDMLHIAQPQTSAASSSGSTDSDEGNHVVGRAIMDGVAQLVG